MKEKLSSSLSDVREYNAFVNYDNSLIEDEQPSYLSYVGNGMFGIPVKSESWLYIRKGRTLSLKVPWQPIITHNIPEGTIYKSATLTHFVNGVVTNYQCFGDGYNIEFKYYAHRTLDKIFVQEIMIANPLAVSQEISLKPQNSVKWGDSRTEAVQ